MRKTRHLRCNIAFAALALTLNQNPSLGYVPEYGSCKTNTPSGFTVNHCGESEPSCFIYQWTDLSGNSANGPETCKTCPHPNHTCLPFGREWVIEYHYICQCEEDSCDTGTAEETGHYLTTVTRAIGSPCP